MALDPIFTNIIAPFRYPPAAEAHFTRFEDDAETIRFDISSLESDIDGWEDTITRNQKEIPGLERETLTCQRDVAVAKLKIINLKDKLAAQMVGG